MTILRAGRSFCARLWQHAHLYHPISATQPQRCFLGMVNGKPLSFEGTWVGHTMTEQLKPCGRPFPCVVSPSSFFLVSPWTTSYYSYLSARQSPPRIFEYPEVRNCLNSSFYPFITLIAIFISASWRAKAALHDHVLKLKVWEDHKIMGFVLEKSLWEQKSSCYSGKERSPLPPANFCNHTLRTRKDMTNIDIGRNN